MRPSIRIFGLSAINILFIFCFLPIYANLQTNSGVNPAENTFYFVAAFLLSFWQPWLIFFALFGFLFGVAVLGFPPITVPLFFAVVIGSASVTNKIYSNLYYGDKLNGLCRLGPRRLGVWVGAWFCGLLCLGALVSLAAHKDFPPSNRDTPHQYDINGARGHFVLTDNLTYKAPSIPYTSEKFIWRAHIARAEMPRFAKYLKMQRTDGSAIGDAFWEYPPYWWRRPSGAVETYAVADSLHSYAALYEPQSETLYFTGEVSTR